MRTMIFDGDIEQLRDQLLGEFSVFKRGAWGECTRGEVVELVHTSTEVLATAVVMGTEIAELRWILDTYSEDHHHWNDKPQTSWSGIGAYRNHEELRSLLESHYGEGSAEDHDEYVVLSLMTLRGLDGG